MTFALAGNYLKEIQIGMNFFLKMDVKMQSLN